MNAKEPLEQLFQQIKELVQMAEGGTAKLSPQELPADIHKRLEKLAYEVEAFCRLGEEEIKKTKISEERIQQTLSDSQNIPLEQRQLLQDAHKLKEEVDRLSRDAGIAATIVKQHEKNLGKEGKQSSARKKKFWRLGGKKNWKPL